MSAASRSPTQLGYRLFPSILISLTEFRFPQSVEVSRLLWLLAPSTDGPCALLLRVVAVASRCWIW